MYVHGMQGDRAHIHTISSSKQREKMLEYQTAHFLLTRSDLKVATTKKFATGSFHQMSVPSPDPREQEQIVHERF